MPTLGRQGLLLSTAGWLTSNGVAACAQRPGVSDGMAAEQGLQRTGSAKRRVHNWGVALVVGALSISMSQLLNTFLRDCKRLSNSGRVLVARAQSGHGF